MPKHWKHDEIALASLAYIGTTMDPVKGSNQDFHTFTTQLTLKYSDLPPKDCGDGTYHKRGYRVYPYLRDNVFPENQKFNKALRTVYCSNHTGVTEDEKVRMAIAIHLKETKKMDYQYKSYPETNWKLYTSWVHLKKIPII